MSRVLFITARIPAPLDDGWKIRTYHLMKGYSQQGWKVDLVSFRDVNQNVEDFPMLQSLCNDIHLVPRTKSYSCFDLVRGLILPLPFHVYNYQVKSMNDTIQRVVSHYCYDLIQIEDIVMTQYCNPKFNRITRILDMHNVESDLLYRYSRNEKNPLKVLYARFTAAKLKKYERKTAKIFQQLLVCSKEDLKLLRSNGVNVPAVVVPNGVDGNYFRPSDQRGESDDLVFIGSMDYHANISGVTYFVNEVLPLIWQNNPEIRFFIVGKNPPEEIQKFAEKRIVVTGIVDDVRPYYNRAGVVVVPLLVGGGTRLKVVESMAMGKAVVSTSLGAEGIPAEHGKHLLLADDPTVFAKSVLELLGKPTLRNSMGKAARKFVEGHFEWSSITRSMCHNLPRLNLRLFPKSCG
jgi:sugar transferase (PEP-CTERM/EpsH1 system associated)